MTVCPEVMAELSVSSMVEPETSTAVTALSMPSVVTEKEEAAAVVEERVSL